ncbi:MAG: 2-oxo acid dehydrogenase subunit E2, partial [Verrucomicrobiales bacterium]|nr:2-oxo acid dehydrogenase subunit E2 [Verrucomicrobiales bacterium]
MPTDIKIPALGESITGGQIAAWKFKTGDTVRQGDVLLELETDKVAQEITAEVSGSLTILKNEGEDVAIGDVIGSIDESVAPAAAAPTPSPEPPQAAPAPTPEAPAAATPAPAASAPPPPAPPKPAPAPRPEGRETRRKMSPLRRKIADHLVNAQQTAAILTTFNEVDMSAIMGLRKSLQEGFVAKHGVKLGFMSFFIKASVEA